MSDIKETYRAFVAKLFNRTGDLSKDFSHAVLGIVTETHELRHAVDEINSLEEAGDLTFFVAALERVLRDFIGDAFDEEAHCRISGDVLEYALAQAESDYPAVIQALQVELMDAAKRWVGYGKAPVTPYRLLAISKVVHALVLGANLGHDITLERVLKANMAKLLKRYPAGEFDAFHAVVRDTEAERHAVAAV